MGQPFAATHATSDVLMLDSLQGKEAKKTFQNYNQCKIITNKCSYIFLSFMPSLVIKLCDLSCFCEFAIPTFVSWSYYIG